MKAFLTVMIGVFAIGLAINSATAADNNNNNVGSTRDRVQNALREMASPIFTERISGLQRFNTIYPAGEARLFSDLKVVEKVRALAEKTDEPVPVRVEALKTLVKFNQKGLAVPKLLELLTSLIKRDNNMPVVNAALELIDDTAPSRIGKIVDQERDRAFAALTEILKDRKRLPVSTQAALMIAIGNFSEKKGTIDVLQKIAFTESEDGEVRQAAMRAMRTALILQSSGDMSLAKNLQDKLVKAGDPEMKVLVLDILEAICANMPIASLGKLRLSAASRKEIVAMMQSGDENQVLPAVKFLMRMIAQDATIVDELLKAAVPAEDKPVSMSALERINSALGDALYNLGGDRKNAVAAKKIIDHLLDLLDPKNAVNVPVDIRRAAIKGLGIIPPIFDRREPVACLLALLEIEAGRRNRDTQQTQLIEESLSALTGQSPFTSVEYGGNNSQRKESPDIAAWNDWFAKNQSKLAGS